MSRTQVEEKIGEVLAGLRGLKGIHCCDNTDWSLVLSPPIDVLSFDAYNFAGSLALYKDDVNGFVRRGGVIAWGIVPTAAHALGVESAATLAERLSAIVDTFARKASIALRSCLPP